MFTLNRALRALTIIAFQFTLGHALGFGTTSMISSTAWGLAGIAVGNAVGVMTAGMLFSGFARVGVPNRLRASAGALLGAIVGAVLLRSFAELGYAGLLLPLTASIIGYHAAQSFTRGRAATAPETI